MPWLGTFHSIGAKMLRRHAELVGLQSNFTILDTDDQLRLLKQLIAAADIDEKRWPARLLAGLIDRWKNKGWTPDQVDAGEAEAYANGKGAKLYAALSGAAEATLNACDFGDLLLHMLVILQGPTATCSSTTSSASNTSWSTNIRTPTRPSISGSACSRRSARTSAASATTTSRSIPGAAPRSPTSCASRRISRAPRSSGSSRITARPRTSSPPPPA